VNIYLERDFVNAGMDSTESRFEIYCDVLAGNTSNLWVLDFMLDLLDISSGGITLNY
jgi:hypothetical protein